jgi:glycosyltransferase involved in cell wall biosynthesis
MPVSTLTQPSPLPPVTQRLPAVVSRLRPRTPIDLATARVSVLVPVYNERDTVEIIVDLIRSSPIQKEIICVDDASTDGTKEILEDLLAAGKIDTLYRQPVNCGKGAAIRRALSLSTGDIVIVQDADLEYDPADWPVLFEPIIDGRADACFGSRFLGGTHRVLYYWHSVGNRMLTTFSNMLTNLNLTDMETCYKVFRREVLDDFELEEDRFGIEPEITAKVAAGDWRIYEVGISYSGRTYDEGKKIGWRDGVRAMVCIVRYSPAGERVRRRPSTT